MARYLVTYSCDAEFFVGVRGALVASADSTLFLTPADLEQAQSAVSHATKVCTGQAEPSSRGHKSVLPIDEISELLSVLQQALGLHYQYLKEKSLNVSINENAQYQTFKNKYQAFLSNAQRLGR